MTQTECMEELYPRFIECGYSPLLFDELSPSEIVDMLTSHARLQEREDQLRKGKTKETITILDATVTTLIHNLLTLGLGTNGGTPISLESLFPGIFAADTPRTSETEITPEMKLYKARRLDAAYRFNEQRHRKGQG